MDMSAPYPHLGALVSVLIKHVTRQAAQLLDAALIVPLLLLGSGYLGANVTAGPILVLVRGNHGDGQRVHHVVSDI